MSALQELRKLLRPDIEEMVEDRLKERLPSIIEALMPSILQHVADSMQIHHHGLNRHQAVQSGNNSYEIMKPEMDYMHLQIRTGPGTIKHIGSAFTVLDQQKYGARIEYIYQHIRDVQDRIQLLETQSNYINSQTNNASTH